MKGIVLACGSGTRLFPITTLSEASIYVEVLEKRQGLKISCLEGIAYMNGWISADKLRGLAKPMLKNQYGQYLMKISEEDNLQNFG